MSCAFEVNFDSIVGPTHNYAGLSFGNIASQKHARSKSNPKQAALQGLAKMKFLYDLGVKQAVLPPHARPHLNILRRLGFTGNDKEMIAGAAEHPRLLAAVYSASAMWAANAATISPSVDCADGRLHITPANLLTQFHRSIEPVCTGDLLRQIFADEKYFAHHQPLPASPLFADEGAANHMRMAPSHGEEGIEIFVYGAGAHTSDTSPQIFPARQTFQSTQAIARLHQLRPVRTVLVRQHPDAIDAGVFHNDVIAVANCDVLLCHERAWTHPAQGLEEIRSRFAGVYQRKPRIFVAEEGEISLEDAVQTYIFNSQIVSLPDGTMALIAPLECESHAGVQRFIQKILAANSPIRAVHYLDVRQSMRNGGGPACLRLRVVVNQEQWAAIHAGVIFSEELYAKLVDWVQRHYRDELSLDDLRDPQLIDENRVAIAALESILNLKISDQ
ncbi:MAG TPA: N-succinylarginine dihydrolase [Tepidisphaeraceae bacterium]|jgi:succinylarginine dihydrolase